MALPLRPGWWATALVAVSVGLTAGCGGGEDGPSEAGGPPAPPAQAPEAPPAAKRPKAGRDDETPDKTGSDERSGGARAGDNGDDSGAPDGSSGSRTDNSEGGADPDKPDEEGNDLPPPAGSPAERFERFCERNPRECF